MKIRAVCLFMVLALLLSCVGFSEEAQEAKTVIARVVPEEGARMRCRANVNADTVVNLPCDARVTVISEYNNFALCTYKTLLREYKGYVWAGLLEIVEDETAEPYKVMYISAYAGLVMRAKPSLSSQAVVGLPFGQAVTVMSRDGMFYKCRAIYNNMSYEGYMWAEYLCEYKVSESIAMQAHKDAED